MEHWGLYSLLFGALPRNTQSSQAAAQHRGCARTHGACSDHCAPGYARPCPLTGGGSLGDEEGMDMAVFRFTLGIPGFEDRFIPRVVGALGASLVVVNHFLGAQVAPPSQVRPPCVHCAHLVFTAG